MISRFDETRQGLDRVVRAAFAAAHQHEPFQCRREKAKRRKRHRKKGKGTE